MLHNDDNFKSSHIASVLLNRINKRVNRCRLDKRLDANSFFKTYNKGAVCYHYRSQHKHYIVMKFKGGLKLYSTNGVSFSGTSLATHSVIEGVFGI